MMSPYVPSSSSIRLSEYPLFLESPYGPLRRIEGRKHRGTREETRLVHVVLDLEVRRPAIRAMTRRAYVQGLYQLYSLLNYWPPPRPRLLSQTFQADRYETTMTGLNPHRQPLKRGEKQAYDMITSVASPNGSCIITFLWNQRSYLERTTGISIRPALLVPV